ncbi:MAG: Crp/Fnr family transcriptional regulator [Alphaproteobacteria bacterium]|nr:Crp/Fnr family transcriptional regulator [Alphaproteobacteria bacterium]
MAGREEGALDGIALLEPLNEVERMRVDESCSWRRYAAGEQILDRDSPTNDVLFITEGEVRVVNYSSGGRETAFAVIPAGSHVGEIAAIDGQSRSASVVALKPCTIAALPAERFRMLYQNNAAIASQLLRHLTAIIRITNERVAELSTVSAVQRIYRELLRLCKPGPGKTEATIAAMPTQQELASKIGATRETVARALGQLVNTGVIERRGRTLLIRDREMLGVMADPEGEAASNAKDA